MELTELKFSNNMEASSDSLLEVKLAEQAAAHKKQNQLLMASIRNNFAEGKQKFYSSCLLSILITICSTV